MRAIVDDRTHHVVQVKQFRVPNFSKLLSAAEEQAERFKDKSARPTSYRFVTSSPLTHRRQLEIMRALGPLAPSTDSVLGESDVRRLLRAHPEVEARHVKLWLPETGVLQRLLNAAAFERSESLVADTRDSLPRYVQTKSFFNAREMLRTERVCVIAGPPGVGKTTLARLLMMDGLRTNYQPYVISPDRLDDAWSLLAYKEKQLFMFDDFLGKTALFESREDDEDLVRLIKRITTDPDRLFILTTREYILQQAQQLSEVLERETADHHKFLFNVDDYSRMEKARIFYNHVYFSDDVDEVAKESLLAQRNYIRVVDHPSFSPRLIEGITGLSGYRLSTEDRANYADFCIRTLEHPTSLWRHAFENGIGVAERSMLFALLGMSQLTTIEDLELAFDAICTSRGIDTTERRFTRAFAVLNDSFLRVSHIQETITVKFLNPSLIDFLKDYLAESASDLAAAVKGTYFLGQTRWLWGFANDQGRTPSDTELGNFGDAFIRTISVVQDDTRPASIAELAAGARSDSTPSGRIELVLDSCLDDSRLLAHCRSALLDQGALLASQMIAESKPTHSGIRLLRALVEHCDFEISRFSGELKIQIQKLEESVDRWDLLDDLRRADPRSLAADELDRERIALTEFAEIALRNGARTFDHSFELEELAAVASYFDVELDQDRFSELEQDFLDDEEARVEALMDTDDDYRREEFDDARGSSDSDADIDLMFERL